MLKEENKKRFIIALGVIFLVAGLMLVSNNYLNEKVDKAYNYMNLELLALNEVSETEVEPSSSVVSEEEPKDEVKTNYYYVAKLSIPKIGLEQGIVNLDSKYNNVNLNIQTISGSMFPDIKNGNLILASHSGNSKISYFRYLYKLSKGDFCYVSYNDKVYAYRIVNIYTKPKTGKIAIYRDYEKNNLTLITCTEGDKNSQTVYIAELFEIK